MKFTDKYKEIMNESKENGDIKNGRLKDLEYVKYLHNAQLWKSAELKNKTNRSFYDERDKKIDSLTLFAPNFYEADEMSIDFNNKHRHFKMTPDGRHDGLPRVTITKV